ncbi:hypothetical protein ACFX2A_031707 [Malus domestica]
MDIGRQLLGRKQALPGVQYLLYMVQVEGTFPDGIKLIAIHDPIYRDNGNLELALKDSFLPGKGYRILFFLVGSHYHFIEVNPGLVLIELNQMACA